MQKYCILIMLAVGLFPGYTLAQHSLGPTLTANAADSVMTDRPGKAGQSRVGVSQFARNSRSEQQPLVVAANARKAMMPSRALPADEHRVAGQNSTFSATRNQQVTELGLRYQLRRQEERNQRLRAANARQHRQIRAGIGGLLVLLTTLGALSVVYIRLRNSRRKTQQQADQLTLMMKEMHHRVKNNLAIVSSLLFLQTTHLDDDDMIQEIRVSQQRVEAMSLIHQRLYQTDQTTAVDMHDYLTDLTESLQKAYGYPAKPVDLRLDIERLNLDIDIAVPVGLITNELITNAFKHAYTHVRQPRLRVGLHSVNESLRSGLVLEVQDNGPGIDVADWQQTDLRNSFGKHLITLLSQQLDGQFELSKEEGTLFRLFIPQTRLRG